jgi:maltose alpha-D-glucosyltransferase/alpha-amylase
VSEHHDAIADSFSFDQPRDPEWYRRAVFYEVLIRGFQDSTGDGTGDLRGLTSRLDYLEWLGIDCIWLLPIYPSPLRDGGYDIADFMAVLPEYGNIGDFVALVDEAHKRGMRVIADLVMNHTSDQHPWFQASRTDPDGPYGDFYVWSDTDDKYTGARVIFVDTEQSNWTFDPVRGQYYWHRFFSHQPDLNFENPRVQDAMIEVLRFWLDLGIDGFRLDAVPYLYEREGTNCENLKETHEYLKRVRSEVDKLYPDRVLLAEANQWPADVIEYFGDAESGGDECHMAFHFPLMPRIFMAVRREQRYPISEILAQTPPIPSSCQWGIFLRNHDGLPRVAPHSSWRRPRREWHPANPHSRLGMRRVQQSACASLAANAFIRDVYLPVYNVGFAVAAAQPGSAFTPIPGVNLDEILCLQEERQVMNDNCVFVPDAEAANPRKSAAPAFVKALVKVHVYSDGSHAHFH